MSALISVVIPARNEEDDLPVALGHVGRQDIDPSMVEVIVVDGDSTDQTARVAAASLCGLAFNRWAVLSNPGGNTPSNLNRGLDWAEGDYIVRVDARSRIPADYLRRTVGVLADRPEVVVTGGSQVAVARDRSVRAQAIAQALNNPLAMGGSRYRRAGASSGPADTVYMGVFRRKDLFDVGGWDEHFSTNQDFELNHRLGSKGVIWFQSGLSVGYVPRRTVRELFRQYHRFGRWKAHYWRRTGRRPGSRQAVLLASPPAAVVLCAAIPLRWSRRVGAATVGLGLCGVGTSRRSRRAVLSWLVNGVVGLAWWTGSIRGLVHDDVA